jgi:hypothetical protein
MGIYEVFEYHRRNPGTYPETGHQHRNPESSPEQGMVTMREDGYLKALAGNDDDTKEVNRVAAADISCN